MSIGLAAASKNYQSEIETKQYKICVGAKLFFICMNRSHGKF